MTLPEIVSSQAIFFFPLQELFIHFLFLFINFLNWSIADLQCWINFRCTAKRLLFQILFHYMLLQVTEYILLYSWALLFISVIYSSVYMLGFPGGTVVKNSPFSAGDTGDAGLTPGLGRSPGERNGNPLQYSCLGNPMDREAWWATVHGVTKESNTTEGLDTHPECIC